MNILTIDCDWAINQDKFFELFDFCFKIFNNKTQIIFIDEHHQTYKFVQKNDTLFNVDQHHDLNFQNSFRNVIEKNVCGAGNWVFGLIYKKIINKYYWICNESSVYLLEDTEHLLEDLEVFVKSTDLNILKNFTFDKIIICKSERYLKNVQFMFNILKKLCDNLNVKYSVDKVNNPTTDIKI
jgi:hypothetical protein